jgi:hypothetical protein
MCIKRPQPAERLSETEIAAVRAQNVRSIADARAEAERRGPRPVHPRILAARADGKTV